MDSITTETIIPIVQALGVVVIAVVSFAKPTLESRKIKKLEKQIRLLTEIPLAYKNSCWYDVDGNPFCPVCRGSAPPLFIPLVRFFGAQHEWECPKCRQRLVLYP